MPKEGQDLTLWMTTGAWFVEHTGGVRLTTMNLKITPGAILLIMKGFSGSGPVVTFYQCKSLEALEPQMRTAGWWESLRWREDKWAFDKK